MSWIRSIFQKFRKDNAGTEDSDLTKQGRENMDMGYIEKENQITPETETQDLYMAIGEYKGRFDALAAYLMMEEFIHRSTIAAILGVELPEKVNTNN